MKRRLFHNALLVLFAGIFSYELLSQVISRPDSRDDWTAVILMMEYYDSSSIYFHEHNKEKSNTTIRYNVNDKGCVVIPLSDCYYKTSEIYNIWVLCKLSDHLYNKKPFIEKAFFLQGLECPTIRPNLINDDFKYFSTDDSTFSKEIFLSEITANPQWQLMEIEIMAPPVPPPAEPLAICQDLSSFTYWVVTRCAFRKNDGSVILRSDVPKSRYNSAGGMFNKKIMLTPVLDLDPAKKDSVVALWKTKSIAENTRHIKPGHPYILNTVQFNTNQAVILESSYAELDGLAEHLKANPHFMVEIYGYTDSIGRAEANIKLSYQRAKAVRDYLVLKGISPSRITFNGLGSANYIADNKTEEGRKKNRRVEFVLTYKKVP